MANRYWVGGGGTWNTTNTANWSTSSGGPGGASVPTNIDNVFFDANSGAARDTCFITDYMVMKDISTAGYLGTLTCTNSVDVYGNIFLESGGSISTMGFRMLNNVAGTYSINFGGRTIKRFFTSIWPSSGTSTVNLQSAINATQYIELYAYSTTFNTNNFNLTSESISIHYGGQSSFNWGTSSLYGLYDLSSSASNPNVNITGTVTASTNSGLSLRLGSFGSVSIANLNPTMTSLVVENQNNIPLTIPNITVNGGMLRLYGTFNKTVNLTSPSGAYWVTLNSNGTTINASTPYITVSGNSNSTLNTNTSVNEIIVSGALTMGTININGPATKTIVRSESSGTQQTITATSYTFSNVAWKDIYAAGNIPFTGTGFVDLGNNTNITLPPSSNGLFFGSNF